MNHFAGVILLVVMFCIAYLVIAWEWGLPWKKLLRAVFIGWLPVWLIIIPSLVIAFFAIIS